MSLAAEFDRELAKRCELHSDVSEPMRHWLNASCTNDKREIAAYTAMHLADVVLSEVGLHPDRRRLEAIGRNLKYFEDLVIGARCGLAGKFYRDHLNHLIRSFLVMRVFAKELPESAKWLETSSWGAEALLHDIGYPVEAARSVFFAMAEGFEESFSGSYYPKSSSLGARPLSVLSPLEDAGIGIETEGLVPLVQAATEYNHALVGASEFLGLLRDYWRNPRCREICSAIALHDPRLATRIPTHQKPRESFLVIADEVQEWGRPAGYETEAVVETLDFLEVVNSGHVSVGIDLTSRGSSYCFSSVCDKLANLSRIQVKRPFSFSFSIKLPVYREVSLAKRFERVRAVLENSQPGLHDAWNKEARLSLDIPALDYDRNIRLWADPNASEIVACDGPPPERLQLNGTEDFRWQVMSSSGAPLQCTRGISSEQRESLMRDIPYHRSLLDLVLRDARLLEALELNGCGVSDFREMRQLMEHIEVVARKGDFVSLSAQEVESPL